MRSGAEQRRQRRRNVTPAESAAPQGAPTPPRRLRSCAAAPGGERDLPRSRRGRSHRKAPPPRTRRGHQRRSAPPPTQTHQRARGRAGVLTPRARNGRKQAAQDAGRGGERAAEAAQPPKRAAASKPAPRPPTARNPTTPMVMVMVMVGYMVHCPARRSAPNPHASDARGAGPQSKPADRRPRPEARGRGRGAERAERAQRGDRDRRRTRPREARAPTRTTPRGRARARRTTRREAPREAHNTTRAGEQTHERFLCAKTGFCETEGKDTLYLFVKSRQFLRKETRDETFEGWADQRIEAVSLTDRSEPPIFFVDSL